MNLLKAIQSSHVATVVAPDDLARLVKPQWQKLKRDKELGLTAIIKRHKDVALDSIADELHTGLVDLAAREATQEEIDGYINTLGRSLIEPLGDEEARRFVGRVIRNTNRAFAKVNHVQLCVSRDALDMRDIGATPGCV